VLLPEPFCPVDTSATYCIVSVLINKIFIQSFTHSQGCNSGISVFKALSIGLLLALPANAQKGL